MAWKKRLVWSLLLILSSLLTIHCGSETEDEESKKEEKKTEETDTDTDTETETESEQDTDTGEVEEMEIAFLIDDFEDGDSTAESGGFWFGYDDNDNGAASVITVAQDDDDRVIPEAAGYGSEYALSVGFSLDQADYEWNPYVGWGVTMTDEDENPFDATEYEGVIYAYKGSAHVVRLETPEVTNWDWFKASMKASTKWTVVKIPFTDFVQEVWDGEGVPFNLEAITSVTFQVQAASGTEGEVVIDNLGFLGEGSIERVEDLVIKEAAPPELEELTDIDITHPAQVIAMETLNKGYNLTNWLEQGDFEDYLFDESTVNDLAAAGFKALRLPIDLDRYMVDREAYFEGEADFQVDPLLFEILDNFESWTAAAGLSLTIDYHQYDGSFDMEDELYRAATLDLWTAVAEHFAGNERLDLFYELMNEPELAGDVSSVSQSEWTAFAAEIIEAIRSVDADHTILFGDVSWNAIAPLTERTPFEDDNMVYLFHFYEPHIFTHQGAGWSGMGTTRDIPYPYSEDRWSTSSSDFGFQESQPSWHFQQLNGYYQTGHKSWLYNEIAEAKAWAVENNVPVICNEFGVLDRSVQKEDMIRYYTDLIDIFETLEIPWQIWFMVMDDDGVVDPDLAEALGL